MAVLDFCFQIAQARVDIGPQVDRLVSHLAAAQTREVQQRIDQLAHFLGGPADALHVLLPFFGETLVFRPSDGFGKHHHRADGRAQIVRHGLYECFQILITQLQLKRNAAGAQQYFNSRLQFEFGYRCQDGLVDELPQVRHPGPNARLMRYEQYR